MSLDENNRDLLVKMHLEKTRQEMSDAELLHNAGSDGSAAGRIYYAIFHAVCALLIHDGIRVKSHKGAYTMFCMHYVNTGKFPQVYGKWYRDMELIREESDYNCFYNVTSDDINERIPQAREMIDAIAKIVEN